MSRQCPFWDDEPVEEPDGSWRCGECPRCASIPVQAPCRACLNRETSHPSRLCVICRATRANRAYAAAPVDNSTDGNDQRRTLADDVAAGLHDSPHP